MCMYQGKSIKTEIFVMMERETCRFKHGKSDDVADDDDHEGGKKGNSRAWLSLGLGILLVVVAAVVEVCELF